jgi:hypothetical protein
MEYQVEKYGIRFYNFYFYEVEKPITIEARSKQESREIMKTIMPQLSDKYRNSRVVGETIIIPLRGVSDKVVKGVRYIWVGEDKARGGWLSEDAYHRAIQMSKRK